MTTKWLGRLNSYSVPGIAMTMDVILNLFLISYFGYPLDILAAGNLGYMLAHVFALSGFLLLRRDRPNWPRPISWRLRGCRSRPCSRRSTCRSSSSAAFIYADKYGYGWDKTWIGIGVLAVGLLLYIWRQGRGGPTGRPVREETPTMPPGWRRRRAAADPGRLAGARYTPNRGGAPTSGAPRSPCGSACGGGPDEVEPEHHAERQQDEDREDVAGQGEEHRQGEHPRARRAPAARGSAAACGGSPRTARPGSGSCPSDARSSRRSTPRRIGGRASRRTRR